MLHTCSVNVAVELTNDNQSFHSENVEVRVRVVELEERNRELEVAKAQVIAMITCSV